MGLELASQTRAAWRLLLLFRNGLSPGDSDSSLELWSHSRRHSTLKAFCLDCLTFP